MTDNDHPAADDLELGELRGRLRGRWKAERRAHEREALHEHWTERDLIDAVGETMDRGDEVAIHLPGSRTLTGQIAGVGRDYALLRSTQAPTRDYAVRLGASTNGDPYGKPVLYVEILGSAHADSVPARTPDLPPTFQAVLQQHDFLQQENPQRRTEIGTVLHPRGVQCVLHAHAGDHLYVRDEHGHDILLPVVAITYIMAVPPRDHRP